jgi:uncharacterized protein (DUF3820 family)
MPDKHNQQQTLIKLANYRMPFGKYANRLLVEVPERYYIWFANKWFPEGELGEFMRMMLEIKTNGLEYLLTPLQNE